MRSLTLELSLSGGGGVPSSGSGGGGGAFAARLVLDGAAAAINLGPVFAGDSATRIPAMTICIGVQMPDPLDSNIGLLQANGSNRGPVDAYCTSTGIVLFAVRSSYKRTAFATNTMIAAQTSAGVFTAGQDVLFILTFDGTEADTGPGVGDPGTPALYVNNVNETALITGFTGALSAMDADIHVDNNVAQARGGYRCHGVVEGVADPTARAALQSAFEGADPAAFTTALTTIGTVRVDVPVLVSDNAASGGALVNRGSLANAIPIQTEIGDLQAVA